MSSPRVLRIASGNGAKLALFRSLLPAEWQLIACDPGDAEDAQPRDYADAALAKLRAVVSATRNACVPALAHDSGFEFACLDGRPGPLSRAWLEANTPDEAAGMLVPGTAVRIVHCVAVWDGCRETTMLAHDDRQVRADVELIGGGLPLSDVTDGPRAALGKLVAQAVALLEAPLENRAGHGGGEHVS